MEVRINKEVRDYTESIFMGLSIRQFICSIIACIVAVIIYFCYINKLGVELTTWLCILGVFPFASLGFVTFQSMNAEDIVKNAWRSFLLSKTNLIDQPYNLYYELTKDLLKKYKKEALRKDVKKLSKNKTTK